MCVVWNSVTWLPLVTNRGPTFYPRDYDCGSASFATVVIFLTYIRWSYYSLPPSSFLFPPSAFLFYSLPPSSSSFRLPLPLLFPSAFLFSSSFLLPPSPFLSVLLFLLPPSSFLLPLSSFRFNKRSHSLSLSSPPFPPPPSKSSPSHVQGFDQSC